MGVCNVVGFAVAVQFGIVAVALAYAACAYLLAPLPIIAVRRVLGLSWALRSRPQVAPAVSSALMAAVVYGAHETLLADSGSGARLAAGVGSGVLVYVSALRLLGPQQFRDLVSMIVTALPPLGRLAARRRRHSV